MRAMLSYGVTFLDLKGRNAGEVILTSGKTIAFDPKLFLSKESAGLSILNYRQNETVYPQGDPANSVFYIQEGKVKKSVVSKQGKEAVIGMFGAGDFFGEGCLAGQVLRMA